MKKGFKETFILFFKNVFDKIIHRQEYGKQGQYQCKDREFQLEPFIQLDSTQYTTGNDRAHL
jgi:hypothetical protein